ncbi:hypothetical protein [Bartonella phoceensis]|uniref:hypothetical protein n=1 Tax=Bartonella phoceensis TaxID=270249 RepID=UPI003CCD1191
MAKDKWVLEVMMKNLTVTYLRDIKKGYLVNAERAAKGRRGDQRSPFIWSRGLHSRND